MSRKKTRGPKSGSGKESPEALMQYLANEMEKNDSAEALNDNVLIPFMVALEQVADARGYVLNIYGEKSNLVFTNEEHVEAIYELVEGYLDEHAEPVD